MKTPMSLKTYDVSIKPAGPVHIGSGQVLTAGIEFWAEQNAIGVIDENRAFDLLTDHEIATIRDGKLAAFLGGARRRKAARYACAIAEPLAADFHPQDIREIRQFQRDAFSKPYIPGTTMKGAIRTALLLALSPATVPGQRPAHQQIEEDAFSVQPATGQFPNRDINRFVRVSDLAQQGDTPLAAVYVTVEDSEQPGVPAAHPTLRNGNPVGPVWCEAATAAIEFCGTLTIETGPWTERMSTQQRDALLDPAAALRAWSGELIGFEMRTWGKSMPSKVTAHMQAMQGFIAKGTTLGLLGWGAGWQAKTIGPRISQSQLDRMAGQNSPWRRPTRQDGPITFPGRFPATRKLADTPDGYVPLGWVRIAITPR